MVELIATSRQLFHLLGELFALNGGLLRFINEFMSNSNPISTPAANALDPVAALAALGNHQRWQIMQMLVSGQELTLIGLAATMGRSYNAVHKDMKVLCAAGVVACRFGEDGRVGIFHVPAAFRVQPGIVDYGFCRLRFAGAAEPVISLAKD
jgi:hypothetical protein